MKASLLYDTLTYLNTLKDESLSRTQLHEKKKTNHNYNYRIPIKKKKLQEQKKKYKLFDMGKLRVSVDTWETTTLWISTSLSGFAFVQHPNGTNSGHDKT